MKKKMFWGPRTVHKSVSGKQKAYENMEIKLDVL